MFRGTLLCRLWWYRYSSNLLLTQSRLCSNRCVPCTRLVCQREQHAVGPVNSIGLLEHLLDRRDRTADPLSQRLLRQVKRFTLSTYPIAKRTYCSIAFSSIGTQSESI